MGRSAYQIRLGVILSEKTLPANPPIASGELLRGVPARGFWRDVWRRFRGDRPSLAALVVFFALCVMALGAPWISANVTHFEPDKINLLDDNQPPSAKHWFGTDEYGRDYFTRIVYAGRVSLSIGFLVAGLSLTIGVVFGLAAGYYGGLYDDSLQGLVNVVSSIPGLPLLIIIGSIFRLDALSIALILAALGWTGSSRQVRGLVLSLKQRDYVIAARTVGAHDRRIMFQHILPNVLSIVLVIVGLDIAGAILTESALSFLGFGVSAPTATWGNMLSNSLQDTRYPWLVFFPGLAISMTVLCVFLLADGMRDATDPRLRR